MGNNHNHPPNTSQQYQHFQHSQKSQQSQHSHSQQDSCAHNIFEFKELRIDSRLDSGNLKLAKQAAPGQYDVWIAPDCYKTKFEVKNCIWFYFKVSNVDLQGADSRTIQFRLMNMKRVEYNNYAKQGMVPVYYSPGKENVWRYLATPLQGLKINGPNLEVKFSYNFTAAESQAGVYFAFSFPYSYTDCQNFLHSLEQAYDNHPDIYFHRELLCYSHEGRHIELITITGHDHSVLNDSKAEIEPLLPDLFPAYQTLHLNEPPTLSNKHLHRPFKFKNKKYVFFTARVHPGEPPANYILQGLIYSLLNNPEDPINRALLQNFVFVFIPMLNPDGVYKGYSRTDAIGINWQFTYHLSENDRKKYHGPHAVLEVSKSLSKDDRLVLYIDLHAHSNKDAGFLYGTWHKDWTKRADMRTFARLLDMYSKNFDYNICEFGTLKMLEEPDPNKMGVAKTEVRKQAGVLHAYTLETSFHITIKDPDRYYLERNPEKKLDRKQMRRIGVAEFMEIGEGIKHAVLDMFGVHPKSILPYTFYGCKEDLRKYIVQVMKETWKPKEPQQAMITKKEEKEKIPISGRQNT